MSTHICYGCFRDIENEFCPYCGYKNGESAAKYPFAIPEGTVLDGRYVIGKVLGQGGFGITYVARENNKLGTKLAIKEYYPESLVTRTENNAISTFSVNRNEDFEYGKETFLEEAKTLYQFAGNPNIVRLFSYFEENGTAYFTMEFLEGRSLLAYLREKGGKISFAEAKRILTPIIFALKTVHDRGVVHRDLSPDNIYMCNDGSVKLIDFGAARYSMGDKSRSLDVILKHGFAPQEQYAHRSRQGPYTDVYSLGATFYRAITGIVPPDSIERSYQDELESPRKYCSDITPDEEKVLLKALAVKFTDRFQSMEEFYNALSDPSSVDFVNAESGDDGDEGMRTVALNGASSAQSESSGFTGSKKSSVPSKTKPEKDKTPKEKPTKEKTNSPKGKKRVNIKVIAAAAAAVVAVAVVILVVLKPDSGSGNTSPKTSSQSETTSNSSMVQVTEGETVLNNAGSEMSEEEIKESLYYDKKYGEIVINGEAYDISGSFTIPSEIDGLPVIGIEENAFKYSKFESVTIPASITSIGKGAFTECTNLTSVTIQGQTSIADDAFRGCTSLETCKMDYVTSIGANAFKGCDSLTSIAIPDSVTQIDASAFADCSTLSSVTLGNGMTAIPDSAFYNCGALTSVDIPGEITNIGEKAFSRCISLGSLTLGEGVEVIGMNAFYRCSNLSSVVLPSSLTEIHSGAFQSCGISDLTIPFGCKMYDSNGSETTDKSAVVD